MNHLILILTLRCNRASELMSESLDRRLRLHERMALHGHLFACRSCPVLKRQLDLIRRISGRNSDPNVTLSESAKQRCKAAIRDAN
ncbi:anti-sigma factor family protein [Rubripirellula reticaptiva]|uniref:anti-sigma factor family protein n=1 Tax=Rubripirellula reticaptiva TaxID=2528013 RepID=UPI001648B0E5|nr:zf-HC2 domain-containing protein [Rubripirellula reticaptiva]